MSLTKIFYKYGEITLDLKDIKYVRKTNEGTNKMGEIFPVEYYYETKHEDRFYLTEEQYNSLLELLESKNEI